MIRVLFFAGLREQLHCDALEVEAQHIDTLSQLREYLGARGESWRRALENDQLQMALNQRIARGDCSLNSGDEVAFFPPVTGG